MYWLNCRKWVSKYIQVLTNCFSCFNDNIVVTMFCYGNSCKLLNKKSTHNEIFFEIFWYFVSSKEWIDYMGMPYSFIDKTKSVPFYSSEIQNIFDIQIHMKFMNASKADQVSVYSIDLSSCTIYIKIVHWTPYYRIGTTQKFI